METIFLFFWDLFQTIWAAIPTIWATLSGLIEGAARVFGVIVAALGGFVTWIIEFFGGFIE